MKSNTGTLKKGGVMFQSADKGRDKKFEGYSNLKGQAEKQ